MKTWHQGTGFSFKNSPDCYGESFDVEGAPLNLAVVTVKGKYPESGFLYNQEAHEMAYVLQGSGTVVTKDGETQSLKTGDVVHFASMEKIAWEGDMQLIMVCSPPFDDAKHIVEEAA